MGGALQLPDEFVEFVWLSKKLLDGVVMISTRALLEACDDDPEDMLDLSLVLLRGAEAF